MVSSLLATYDILFHHRVVLGKCEDLGYEAGILWGMVPVGHQSEPEITATRPLSHLRDLVRDLQDIVLRT